MVVRQLMLPRDSLSSMVSLLSLNNTSREPSLVPKNKETRERRTAGPGGRSLRHATLGLRTGRDGIRKIPHVAFMRRTLNCTGSHRQHEIRPLKRPGAELHQRLLQIYIPQPQPFLPFGLATKPETLRVLNVSAASSGSTNRCFS